MGKLKKHFIVNSNLFILSAAFCLSSCGENGAYYKSYTGLIDEHTLNYKSEGLVLGSPQYVYFKDVNLEDELKNGKEIFTNLQNYYQTEDSFILFTGDASFSFKYFATSETWHDEKYCYQINTMYYELYLDDDSRITFYAPSYLEMNLPKKLNEKSPSKISFDDYRTFYSNMKNYTVEETKSRIKLEVYSFNPGKEKSKKLDDTYYLNILDGYSSITKE